MDEVVETAKALRLGYILLLKEIETLTKRYPVGSEELTRLAKTNGSVLAEHLVNLQHQFNIQDN